MLLHNAGVLLKQLVPEEHGLSSLHAGAGGRPPITCHVLDTTTGTPAVGLGVVLARCENGSRCALHADHAVHAGRCWSTDTV